MAIVVQLGSILFYISQVSPSIFGFKNPRHLFRIRKDFVHFNHKNTNQPEGQVTLDALYWNSPSYSLYIAPTPTYTYTYY
ncbi:hypothetical protein NC651_031267 [Populus alba x Populus x berolinensis]|nr:hypothetical protein NC651_031267 [Populus alba x Populus x berolinensis]